MCGLKRSDQDNWLNWCLIVAKHFRTNVLDFFAYDPGQSGFEQDFDILYTQMISFNLQRCSKRTDCGQVKLEKLQFQAYNTTLEFQIQEVSIKFMYFLVLNVNRNHVIEITWSLSYVELTPALRNYLSDYDFIFTPRWRTPL